jgi:hypothetical protein
MQDFVVKKQVYITIFSRDDVHLVGAVDWLSSALIQDVHQVLCQ